MSNFWNNMKQTLSGDKPLELDETSKAIIDIENKKRAISQASENEQNAIKAKITDDYRKVGETSYQLYVEGIFELDKISEMFETIKRHHQTLEEKQAKLADILSRYDEELSILRPTPPVGQAFCKDCGTAYIQGETVFCSNCGNRLSSETADVSIATPTHSPVCAACNTHNLPVATFCSGCGGKL